jgi:hypothetical protein
VAQVPPLQVPLAHVLPQDPQLAASVCVFVYAPPQHALSPPGAVVAHPPQLLKFVCSLTQTPLQMTPGDAQTGVQTPAAHEPLAHTVPQVPQFEASVCVLMLQPSELTPLQFLKPVLQVSWHPPVTQYGAAAFAVPQTSPHEPQLSGSVCVLFVQPVPVVAQSLNGAVHV